MAQLRLSCFHSLEITIDGRSVAFRSNKGRALLVYLAVESDRAHTRSALAGLLWPDLPESRARQNLSQTLLEVRKAIGDQNATPPFLQITPQTIAFAAGSNHWLDVARHGQAIAKHDYAQVISLYSGDFLADFVVPDSDLWEAWVERRREGYRQQAFDALLKLGGQYEAQGQLDDALTTIRRLLTLAPWQEEAHCALMRLLALTGQRSAALAQYDALTQLLMDELGVPPSPAADALYDQILAGELTAIHSSDPSTFTITHSEPPFQPPALPPHFVGRTNETEQLVSELLEGNGSVWALVGMGGAGKTTLAIHIAHLLRAQFVDGVLWANTAISRPMDILKQWGAAYGYDFGGLPDLESRAAAVRGLFASKAVLLILDNVDAAEAIRPLLPGHATCRVLLTTRNLDVAHALNAQILAVGELTPESSLTLLRHILGNARVEAEEAAAVRICKLLHYLPLALEIVAQRLKSRTRVKLATMVGRLAREEHRLALEISDRAIRTSFAVSWDALDLRLQRVFTQLAAFGGRPFPTEASAQVLEMDPFDAEDQLYGLVALSLLQEKGDRYFQQHPLLADFAQEKLGADSAPIMHMIDYYYQFAQEHCSAYGQLEAEWENLSHAIAKAHALQSWQQVADFTNLLAEAWFTQARFDEARQAYALAEEAFTQLHDSAASAHSRLQWAEVCIEQSDYEEAQQLLEASLAYYREANEVQKIALIYYHLGSIAHEQGELTTAAEFVHECLTFYQAANDQTGIAAANFLHAYIYYDQEQFDEARKFGETALQMQRDCQDRKRMIATLRLLSTIQIRLESYNTALDYINDALRLSEELQNRHETATNLYTITAIYIRKRDFERARTYALDALAQFQQLGLRRLEGMIHYQLSALYRDLEEYQQGVSHAQASFELFHQLADDVGCAYALINLGDLTFALDGREECAGYWLKARSLGEAANHAWIQQETGKRLLQMESANLIFLPQRTEGS